MQGITTARHGGPRADEIQSTTDELLVGSVAELEAFVESVEQTLRDDEARRNALLGQLRRLRQLLA